MSLLEVVVVLGVQTILLATAVGLIGRLLQAEQAGRKDLQALMSVDALAVQFRRDANAASEASIVETKGTSAGIELALSADRRATYEVREGSVQRVERQAEEVLHREAYRLPRTWSVSFQELSERPRRMLRMTITVPGADETSPNSPRLTCDTALGRDRDMAMLAERSEG
jgi:hypothetical protein